MDVETYSIIQELKERIDELEEKCSIIPELEKRIEVWEDWHDDNYVEKYPTESKPVVDIEDEIIEPKWYEL